jgi:hypothetical protein
LVLGELFILLELVEPVEHLGPGSSEIFRVFRGRLVIHVCPLPTIVNDKKILEGIHFQSSFGHHAINQRSLFQEPESPQMNMYGRKDIAHEIIRIVSKM